jgi:hypothetical protein
LQSFRSYWKDFWQKNLKSFFFIVDKKLECSPFAICFKLAYYMQVSTGAKLFLTVNYGFL